jgi:hypothetical protein
MPGSSCTEDGSANVCLALRKSLFARSGGEPARLLADLAAANPAFARRLGDDWRDHATESVGSVPYGWIARGHPVPGCSGSATRPR